MTVAELIEKLKEFPPDTPVICPMAYEDGYWPVGLVELVNFSSGTYVNIDPPKEGTNKIIVL